MRSYSVIENYCSSETFLKIFCDSIYLMLAIKPKTCSVMHYITVYIELCLVICSSFFS